MRIAEADLETRRNIITAPVRESYPVKDGFKCSVTWIPD